MRKIISFMHISLDGLVAGPRGEIDQPFRRFVKDFATKKFISMNRYFYILLFCFLMSCNQNPSQAEKDYIKNLEEKNKALEKELQEVKSKTESKSKPSKDYFTIGSTEKEVLDVMGTPTSYIDVGSLGKRFMYGFSSVSFKNGKVESYNNLDKNLKVKVK